MAETFLPGGEDDEMLKINHNMFWNSLSKNKSEFFTQDDLSLSPLTSLPFVAFSKMYASTNSHDMLPDFTKGSNYAFSKNGFNLNPYAKTFSPKNNTEDGLIGTFLFIIIFLSNLIIVDLLTGINVTDNISSKDRLRKLKLDNPNKIVIGHLNINSIRNKFLFLKEIVDSNIDIFLVSETKLNDTFPDGQFTMDGFHLPFREDRNDRGGGLILFIRDHIPCRRIKVDFTPKIEAIVIEINLKKRKWLLFGIYNPRKDMITNHLDSIGKQLNTLCENYENFILIGDFNSEMCEDAMQYFCNIYNLKNLVKEPTCFKNIETPTCIDLILTNRPLCFQNTSVIDVGLSDFHKVTITTIKANFQKQKPIIVNYRNYKFFNNIIFRNELMYELSKTGFRNIDCKHFETLFMEILNRHAPLKKKYIRANNSPFINKSLSKAIMVRSKLRNKYLKLKTVESHEAYKCQRNYCVSLLRKTKKEFYENLNPSLIADCKTFWKQVKPFFSDKTIINSNIILLEGNEIISTTRECAEVMNTFFSDAVNKLDIDRTLYVNHVTNLKNPVENAILMFNNHPSILSINELGYAENNFSFQAISELSIYNVINDIDSSKSYLKDNIPPKILKENNDICAMVLSCDINQCIYEGKFPEHLKNADITPIFKKGDRMSKLNYRAVSILPTLSKIYEKILYRQIYEYFDKIFSKYLSGFRKGHSTQHCLLFMLESLRKALDNGLCTGILLTDLSKAFDCISHDLLIAKLKAYGFSINSLNLVKDYLNARKQRTKIGESFSTWREIIYGVPQGSILGPLLFNIYINDIFLFSKNFNIANYADDCSPYEFCGSIDDVIYKLENDSHTLMDWYEMNYLKPNPDKWHLIVSEMGKDITISIDDNVIANSDDNKILGVNFDNKLNFKKHITKLCKKASQKLHALARLSNLMSCEQRKIIMNAFISSHFSYCPLIWMCHSRSLHNHINKIHERALRIVYKDNTSSFKQLLKLSGSISIHHKNLQLLAIEIYKALNNLSSPLMADLFHIKGMKYNLRNKNMLVTTNNKTSRFGIESIAHLAPKIWDLIPEDIKNSKSLAYFKTKIRLWVPDNCPCKLCKVYVHNIGYI